MKRIKSRKIHGPAFFSVMILLSTLIPLAFQTGCSGESEKKDDAIKKSSDLPRPSWVAETPIVFIGNWDAMPIFRRRIGANPAWQEEGYYKEHTEEMVKKYKDMGVTMMMLHFYKGFGLQAEKEHMEEAKKLASLCKQQGLKVGVYVGSTIFYETFLAEKPEAKDWFVPDYLGQPVIYGMGQTFRKRVYFMHPGFIQYMKEVVRIAIVDLKVDLIHFDNTSMRAQPEIFHHPMAIENFRTYLQQKYDPATLKKRFGFSEMRFIEPPKLIRPIGKYDDPLFQEWTDFRCKQLADFYGIMESHIRGLNPEVAVENNPHSGLSGNNTMWDQGVDYPQLLAHTDYVWTEEGNDPAVTDDGILISKIRTYKMARTLNNRIFTYTTDSKLEMAESMAYNRQGVGMVGGLKEMEGNQLAQGFDLPADQKKYIDFYHDHFDYYRGIRHIADVAVLHSYSTMAYNNDRPYQSTYLYEQVLIQEKIPFDIIFDDQLKDLSKYKVLVLADQECLDDKKLELIRAFVRQGGGLVATEFTSLYTPWRERKSEFGLKDLFRIDPPHFNGRPYPESILQIPVQKNQESKGRVVYIPEVRPSIPKPTASAMTSRYWKLPLNNDELADAVRWAAGSELSVIVNAPKEVTIEFAESEKKDRLLHLVNFNTPRVESVRDIRVNMELPEGKQFKDIQCLSPDRETGMTLNYSIKEGRIIFTIPELKVYNLLVISLQ